MQRGICLHGHILLSCAPHLHSNARQQQQSSQGQQRQQCACTCVRHGSTCLRCCNATTQAEHKDQAKVHLLILEAPGGGIGIAAETDHVEGKQGPAGNDESTKVAVHRMARSVLPVGIYATGKPGQAGCLSAVRLPLSRWALVAPSLSRQGADIPGVAIRARCRVHRSEWPELPRRTWRAATARLPLLGGRGACCAQVTAPQARAGLYPPRATWRAGFRHIAHGPHGANVAGRARGRPVAGALPFVGLPLLRGTQLTHARSNAKLAWCTRPAPDGDGATTAIIPFLRPLANRTHAGDSVR